VGPGTSLDDMENTKFLPLLGHELRPLDCPAHSQSLYRLRYPGSFYVRVMLLTLKSVTLSHVLLQLCNAWPIENKHSTFIFNLEIHITCLQVGLNRIISPQLEPRVKPGTLPPQMTMDYCM
jgi:hypothetical protein